MTITERKKKESGSIKKGKRDGKADEVAINSEEKRRCETGRGGLDREGRWDRMGLYSEVDRSRRMEHNE